MQQDINIRVTPEVSANRALLKQIVAQHLQKETSDISDLQIVKRSVDARQRNIIINLQVRVYMGENYIAQERIGLSYAPLPKTAPQAIIVGAGPAGLFAALRLIRNGIKPIVIERGKDVRQRKRDLAIINRTGIIDSDSNYCFGEGGAGAYSDGKLYTRSKKKGNVDGILNILFQFGADENILIDAHPHIGTDRLPSIIENIRKQIISCGGEVLFETKMTNLIIENQEVKGIETLNGLILEGEVILATGHSARDVYYMLQNNGIKMEAKALAVGFRIEHRAQLIDQIQYHSPEGRGLYLPAAEYSYTVQSGDRGVYSFCMCPGGIIVPAASAPEQVVVNGMSSSARGSQWSNSGFVVEIHPQDLPEYEVYNELSMLKFQEETEHKAWIAGGCSQSAPAQRMCDFVNSKKSNTLPCSSYVPGTTSSCLHEWMPPFIVKRLQDAFQKLGRIHKGYLTNEALLLGVETRTSSPLRIVRDKETFMHTQIKGLYPCGEGAGYAGGIVSAAIDGELCADALAGRLKERKSNPMTKS